MYTHPGRTFLSLLFSVCFVVLTATQTTAGVLISEVMYLPESDPLNPGDEEFRQWVELYNMGPAVSLSDYELVNGAGVSFGSLVGMLGSGDTMVLYDKEFSATGPTSYDSSLFANAWGISESSTLALDNWQTMSMDNTPPNKLVLRDVSGVPTAVHTLDGFNQGAWTIPNNGYSIFLTNLFSPEAPESWSSTHIDPLPGSSTEAGDYGTPGLAEFAVSSGSVPEPISLFTFAIFGVVSVARRRKT